MTQKQYGVLLGLGVLGCLLAWFGEGFVEFIGFVIAFFIIAVALLTWWHETNKDPHEQHRT